MKRLSWALLAALLAFPACNPSAQAPASALTLERFTVNVPGVEFPTHNTLQLQAWGLYSDGSKVDVSGLTDWSSSDESVGRIGPTGIAQLDGVGMARFEARFEGRRASIVIHVTGAELQSLKVTTSETGGIARGDSRRFTAIAIYSDGTSLDVSERATWTADGVAFDTTAVPGVVRGRAEGHGVLRATWYSQQTSVALDVVGPRFAGLELAGLPAAVHPGETQQLVVLAKYSDGSTQNVSAESAWTSSNPGIADVSMNGVVQGAVFARGAGTATITARWNETTASLQFVVLPHRVVEVAFDSMGLQLPQGRSATVDLFAQLEDGSRTVVTGVATWTSSQPGVAEVSRTGAVTARALGTATLTARYAGLEASWDVEVTPAVIDTLTASMTGGRLLLGQSADFIVVGTYSDGSVLNLSSVVTPRHGPAVVSVALNDRLKVTGVDLGPAVVEFEVSGARTQVAFEVTNSRITSVVIHEMPQHITSGLGSAYQGARRFRALATYEDGVGGDVTELGNWWLEDASIATMSDAPGSRGAYLLDLGGDTTVHFAIVDQNATLAWSFPANP